MKSFYVCAEALVPKFNRAEVEIEVESKFGYPTLCMTRYNTLLLDLEENYYDMMAGSIPYWFLIFFVAMAIFVLVFRLLVVAFFQNEMIVLGLCLIHLVAELVLSAGPEYFNIT